MPDPLPPIRKHRYQPFGLVCAICREPSASNIHQLTPKPRNR